MTTADLTKARLSFPGIVRSEWIKLRSLRSTFWCYLIVVLLTIGLAALVAAVIPTDAAAGTRAAAAAGHAREPRCPLADDQHDRRLLRPTRDRGARRPRHHRRIRHRDDPIHIHGRSVAPAGPCGEGAGVRRRHLRGDAGDAGGRGPGRRTDPQRTRDQSRSRKLLGLAGAWSAEPDTSRCSGSWRWRSGSSSGRAPAPSRPHSASSWSCRSSSTCWRR